LLTKRARIGDGLEIPIAMDEQRIMLKGELRNATIDGTSDGPTVATKFEENTCSISPSVWLRFDVFLGVQVGNEQGPFLLVARALQKLKLVETSEHDVVVPNHGLQCVALSASGIAKDVHPNRGIN
jgi:hypothetical protein